MKPWIGISKSLRKGSINYQGSTCKLVICINDSSWSFHWAYFSKKTHISLIIYTKQNTRSWSYSLQISTKLFGNALIVKTFLFAIFSIIPSLNWVKVFKHHFYTAENNKLQRPDNPASKYLFTNSFTWVPKKNFVKLSNTCSLKKFQYLIDTPGQ